MKHGELEFQSPRLNFIVLEQVRQNANSAMGIVGDFLTLIRPARQGGFEVLDRDRVTSLFPGGSLDSITINLIVEQLWSHAYSFEWSAYTGCDSVWSVSVVSGWLTSHPTCFAQTSASNPCAYSYWT